MNPVLADEWKNWGNFIGIVYLNLADFLLDEFI